MGFPVSPSTHLQVGGVAKSGVATINFGAGFTSSGPAAGVLTLEAGAGSVPTSRTLTVTAPITCDGISGAHDLSANRTLAIAPSPTFAGTASADGLAATTSAGIRASGAAASSGVPMVDSPPITLNGSYWDGAAHLYPLTLQHVMLNPSAPTFGKFSIGWDGAEGFFFNQPLNGSVFFGTPLDTLAMGSGGGNRAAASVALSTSALYQAGDSAYTFTDTNGSPLVIIGTDSPDGYTSGAGVLTTGTLVIKEGTIVVGAPDSGGAGFRMLKIAN